MWWRAPEAGGVGRGGTIEILAVMRGFVRVLWLLRKKDRTRGNGLADGIGLSGEKGTYLDKQCTIHDG